MPAGQKYDKHLNYDAAFVKTAAQYDPQRDEWYLPVSINGSLTANHTFHDAATVAADGAAFAVGGYKTLTVEIWGTSTTRTVEFKGAGLGGTYRPIMGVNMATLTTATSTTGSGELWQFDITGLVSVIMDLSAVAGGSVSVKGRAVA